MGSRNSKPPPHNSKADLEDDLPLEIFTITSDTTEQEITRQYHRLLLKHHPDRNKGGTTEKVIKIKQMYERIKLNNFKPVITASKKKKDIDFTKYTRKFLAALDEEVFYKVVDDLFASVIGNEPEIIAKFPKFGDKFTKMSVNSQFYSYFRSFRTNIRFDSGYTENYRRQHGFNHDERKFYEKESDRREKKLYNEAVRGIVKNVLAVDPRLKRNIHESSIRKEVVVKGDEKTRVRYRKDASKYKFYCDVCLKGFMSDQTMIQHLRGSKHKNMVNEKGMVEISYEEILTEMKQREIKSMENGTTNKSTQDEKEGEFVDNYNFNKEDREIDRKVQNEHKNECYEENCLLNNNKKNTREQDLNNVYISKVKNEKVDSNGEEDENWTIENKLYNLKIGDNNMPEKTNSISTNKERSINTIKAVNNSEQSHKCNKDTLSCEQEDTENINVNEIFKDTKNIEDKIRTISVKQKKGTKKTKKTFKKKTIVFNKENHQLLTCSYCKDNYDSRNKLFEHIRNEHTKSKEEV